MNDGRGRVLRGDIALDVGGGREKWGGEHLAQSEGKKRRGRQTEREEGERLSRKWHCM